MKSNFKAFSFASRIADDTDNRVSALASFDEEKKSMPRKKAHPQSATNRQSKFTSVTRKNSLGADLFHYVEPMRSAADVVLDQENFRLLAEIVDEFRRGDDLRRFGLSPRTKLLFCGPPGCGKTLCAEVLAYELRLPLVVARLDGIITTYLGETASNLRQLFEAATVRPCVLFLDEFDALARARTDATEHNEIRRVVNSLLMLIDEYQGRGLLIAATNLQHSIDAAAWRRFDEVVFFKNPAKYQILRLIKNKTRNFHSEVDFEQYLPELVGMTFAEIERVCLSAIKREILSHSTVLTTSTFMASIKDEKRRISIRDKLRNS